MVEDLNASNPGPEPTDEYLTSDEILAKYGADLEDDKILTIILNDLVAQRKLSIAVARKQEMEARAREAWINAYVKRYGTDEG